MNWFDDVLYYTLLQNTRKMFFALNRGDTLTAWKFAGLPRLVWASAVPPDCGNVDQKCQADE